MGYNPTLIGDRVTDFASIFILCAHVLWDAIECGENIISLFVVAAVYDGSAQVIAVTLELVCVWLLLWFALVMNTSCFPLGGKCVTVSEKITIWHSDWL